VSRPIHRLASNDFAEVVRFYRTEARVGLARRFLTAFERFAKMLERHPGLGTPTAHGRRAHLLSGFLCCVMDSHQDEALRILVVRHQIRDPAYGEGRQECVIVRLSHPTRTLTPRGMRIVRPRC
jgi:plasmid stabilization system protein ParE